jgi:hypothetical protein
VGGDESLQELRKHIGADGGRGGDDQVPGRRRHHLLERITAFEQRAHRPLRKGHPRAARLGEPHPAGRPQEELRAQLALQAVEPRCERRLRDEEGLGGAADAAPAGHLEEALDL